MSVESAFSFDYADLFAVLLAMLIPLASIPFVVRRSNNRSRDEVVDGDVLTQFGALFERIGKLEALVGEYRVDLDRAYGEIRELKKLEEYLNAKVYDREKRIAALESALEEAKKRIAHLEDVCQRAGISDGEIWGAPI